MSKILPTPAKLLILIFIVLVCLMSFIFPGDTPRFSVLFFFICGFLTARWLPTMAQHAKDEFKRWHN